MRKNETVIEWEQRKINLRLERINDYYNIILAIDEGTNYVRKDIMYSIDKATQEKLNLNVIVCTE